MASVSAPHLPSPSPCSSSHTNPNPRQSTSFLAASSCHGRRMARFAPKFPDSMICRCQNEAAQPSDEGSARRRWDSFLHDAVKAAVKRWEDCVESFNFRRTSLESEENTSEGKGKERQVETDVDWDWERWKRHFEEVEEQERVVSILRSQLHDAVCREDYEDAAKLKRAISAVAANDTVGNAIKHLNKAVAEEHYDKAASIRDHAGAGLVGWWAGISEDSADPYGRIIRITAEHGRYVAVSYSSRQLAAGKSGFPLFEVYFTIGNDGKYKQQAVYLKRNNENSKKSPKSFSKSLDDGKSVPSEPSTSGDRNELPLKKDEDVEESDDESQIADGIAGIQNVLQDMIPGVKVKVLKVVAPGKVDRDLISNVVEQIMEDEEDDDKDIDIEILDSENDIKLESDSEDLEINTKFSTMDPIEESADLSLNFVFGGIMQNSFLDMPPKHLVRVPSRLDKKGRFSFSFSIIQDNIQLVHDGKEHDSSEQSIEHSNIRSADLIISDLAKVLVSKEKVPLKVIKDVGELIRLAVNQEKSRQPLHGTMFFNRIEMPATFDPLHGLYVSAHGMLTTEVLYLRRKFGQWHEDGRNQKSSNLEFYEYVEAFKLTGDASVPAGQVAFRAKVGKQNQLPHKGIIPDEFGVVARYKGQGRLAEPGFQNPRWVDGELVILDGKYIRGGPVIGFVYWAPEYHFLMFFNRLKLHDY